MRMLIDVRQSLHLGVKARHAAVVVPTPKPARGTAFPPRRLTLRGVPIFELALWCGTCPAIFRKLAEPEVADVELARERLNAGLAAIDDEVVRTYGSVLPRSTYTVLLLEVKPHLVVSGSKSDYFSHEQVATWGVDAFAGSPEDPGTPYYRTFETRLGDDKHLYEFVVPMVPPTWNERHRTAEYAMADSTHPATAVAYSLLDVVQPAMDEGDDYYEHWVLTHFLLDGHHKFEAAADAGRPIRLLSLLDERISIASLEHVTTLADALTQPEQTRSRAR